MTSEREGIEREKEEREEEKETSGQVFFRKSQTAQ